MPSLSPIEHNLLEAGEGAVKIGTTVLSCMGCAFVSVVGLVLIGGLILAIASR